MLRQGFNPAMQMQPFQNPREFAKAVEGATFEEGKTVAHRGEVLVSFVSGQECESHVFPAKSSFFSALKSGCQGTRRKKIPPLVALPRGRPKGEEGTPKAKHKA